MDTGYYRTPDPYVDMAKAAPYAVNWQIKQSAFGADSDKPIDMVRLLNRKRTEASCLGKVFVPVQRYFDLSKGPASAGSILALTEIEYCRTLSKCGTR